MGIRSMINELLGPDRHMSFQWRNLDDRPRAGCAWFDIYDGERNKKLLPGLCFEWDLKSVFNQLYFDIDMNENEITFAWAVHPIAFWLSITDLSKQLSNVGPWMDAGKLEAYDKRFGVSLREGWVSWNLGYSQHHWCREMPRWRNGSFDVLGFLFGDTEHFETTIKGPVNVQFPMPERSYKGSVELRRETWKRPRLLWRSHEVVRAHIETDKDPIPHPGKGDSSWDCGEDATYGLTCPADSVSDAIGKMVGSVMRDRERYGSLDWCPEQDHRPKPDKISSEPPECQESSL